MSSTNSAPLEQIQLLYGAPRIFENICAIHPAYMRDIGEMGFKHFQELLFILTLDPASLDVTLLDVHPLVYTILQYGQSAEFRELFDEAFRFFCRESVMVLEELCAIQVGTTPNNLLTLDNYKEFQRMVLRLHGMGEDAPVYANEKAQQIAEKIKRSQALVKAAKKKQGNDGEELELADFVSSAAFYISGLSMENVWNLPYVTFMDQFGRMQAYEEYDATFRAVLAGAKVDKSKRKKHWVRKLHSE